MFRFAFAWLAFLWLPFSAFGQTQEAKDRFTFDPDLDYRSEVLSPAAFLGFEAGDEYSFHYQVLDYFRALASASERVRLVEYGKTHEGRTLVYAVISSAENLARLEEIRENNLKLADTKSVSDAEAEQIVASNPAVHWMSYNVHGNEPSSSEAAMHVAYRLAAAEDEQTLAFLKDLVVIIDPMINADGRDRYVYWYKSMQSPILNPDIDDVEHREFWPGGRTNHYWFDLNRDWVWLVHPESQGRIRAYQEWLPQVHIDYHEQGFNNNYFTHPGTTPRNLNLPKDHDRWSEAFGKADAKAFDKHQINYFTKEAFDFFYPGYGSSYPSLMGSIGQLREQGGHSLGGRAVTTNDEYVLTLRQRIFDHYLTSITSLQTSLENKEALQRYFRSAFDQKTNTNPTKAYVLPADATTHAAEIVNMLRAHKVEVLRAEEDFRVRRAFNYEDGKSASRSFKKGDFIIPTNQGRHIFVNTLFQRRMAIEDSIMYDMSSWAVPLAYNLDAAWTEEDIRVASRPVAETVGVPFGVKNPSAGYAFVIDWKQRNATKALAQLWRHEYKVRSLEKEAVIEGKSFSRGSLVVLLGHNRQKASSVALEMQSIAEQTQVEIVGLNTGFADKGIDLASRQSAVLKAPKVAMLIDEPISSYTAGQLWFLLEKETGLSINRVRMPRFSSIDLNEYDVLIVPNSGGLSSALDSMARRRIDDWVKAGGTVVAVERSAAFFATESNGLSGIKAASFTGKDDKDKAKKPDPNYDAYVAFADKDDLDDAQNIAGATLLGHVDTTHPLAFGLNGRLFTLKFGDEALEPQATDNIHTVGYFDRNRDNLVVSGFVSTRNQGELAGKAFAMVEERGRGKIVLLHENTQYRMFYVGPSRLLLNAVMLVPSM